ncbi:MAG: ThuA domain-containing protein [Planctomycetota bacterium]|jgi:trehalose utilization protein
MNSRGQDKIRVTIWNEFRHEQQDKAVQEIYPQGIHEAIAESIKGAKDILCRTATLDEADHGLTTRVLAETDVLMWWGHKAHHEVRDEIVTRVHERVLAGMGFIALHSSHYAKIFQRLLGTSCSLRWREAGERERLWNVEPGHPVAEGIGEFIELPQTEMYGERFDVPRPDHVVFISWFQGGEVFRSGCCWERGCGRIFYFRPGHETYPIYYNKEVRKVLLNAVRWARPRIDRADQGSPNVKPLENLG